MTAVRTSSLRSPAGPTQGDAAEHLVGASRERPQPGGRVAVVAGLAEQAAVADDVGVDAEDERARSRDRTRLADRVLDDDHRPDRPRSARGRPQGTTSKSSPSRPSSSRRRGDAEARIRSTGPSPRPVPAPAQPSSGNQMPISRAADSSESEPWTRLKVTSVPKSPRIEPVVGLDRVGGADQLPGGRDRLDALEHGGDQRAAGDELDELAEERLVGVLGVVLVRGGLARR